VGKAGSGRWEIKGSQRSMLTRLQTSGGEGQEAARLCTCVGGFLPQPAMSERPLSPSM
jgi:hypothetical protein